jgi:hypothetical protein
MSHYAESRYAIERQRRQELFEQRVRETTRTYLERYERVVADVRAQGLAEFVKDELSSIERELSSLSAQVVSDPAAARDRSVSLGNRVHALPRLARGMKQAAIAAQRAAEEAEREAERYESKNWSRLGRRSKIFGSLSCPHGQIASLDSWLLRIWPDSGRESQKRVRH